MKSTLKFFGYISLILLLVSAFESFGQTDSLSIIQGIEEAEIMMERNFPKAKAFCIELNKKTSTSTCQQCKERALILLGKAHWYDGEYKISADYLKRGIKIAKQTGDSTQWAKAASMIGNCFYYQAYYDSAIFYFQQSLSIYEKTKHKAGIKETERDISLMYHRKGDYKKTVEYILMLEELSDGDEEPPRIGDFTGMGNFFSDSLYYREKISDNLIALNMQMKGNKLEAAFKTYLNLALSNNQLHEYVKAARYYVKSFTLQEELGFHPRWDFAGVNYRYANMKDSSLYYHRRAMQGFKNDTQLNVLYSYELLGDTYFYFDQYDSALYNYNIALTMNRNCNNRITVTGIHRKLADVFIKLKQFSEAENQIQLGLALANEVSMGHRRNLYKSATDLYSQTGNYRKAFSFQSQYTNLADSLARLETSLNLTRLLAQSKTSKKERELELLKAKNESSELILENKNVTIKSLAIVTLTSIAFIAVFGRQRYRIKKKSQALDMANKEQVALMREVHHRVKNNLQLIASLINLQSAQITNPEVVQELEKTRSRIMSIALIHQKLYQHESMSVIDLQSFLESLIENILAPLPEEMNLQKSLDIASVKVEIETAISIGLIVNELVTNSIKHGLSLTISPQLNVQLAHTKDKLILTIQDNGPGNKGQTMVGSEGGFGLHLIEILLKRLSGRMETNFTNGTFTRIEIDHQIAS